MQKWFKEEEEKYKQFRVVGGYHFLPNLRDLGMPIKRESKR